MAEQCTKNGDSVVDVRHVTRRFWRKTALDDVSTTVSKGTVFGLVGENGAGKTTLIKILLGLLTPSKGEVRVFGLDPVTDPVGVLSRIGYLSEDRDMPGWMRVGEYMRYLQAFYPGWDERYAEELRQTFCLDTRAKLRTLSRGEKAKAGLLGALAYRPDLLLLDEPSSGLDPVVRRDILSAIIRTVADEGRTVIFSSHLLDEVERVADHVAMLSGGTLVLSASMDELKVSHHRLTLRLTEPSSRPPALDGILSTDGGGLEWTVVCNGQLDVLRASATRIGATVVEESAPSLEEIFVARAGQRKRASLSGED